MVDPEWSESETLPLEEILGLLKRNFTLGVLVEEWVGPDDRNSKRHIIQVRLSPPSSLKLKAFRTLLFMTMTVMRQHVSDLKTRSKHFFSSKLFPYIAFAALLGEWGKRNLESDLRRNSIVNTFSFLNSR